MSDRKPVFLVLGAGAGIGGQVAARFALGGYHAVLARRSDEAGLKRLVGQIEDAGGEASGMLVDASVDGTIENLVERVENEIGPIECALYNLGAQIGNRSLANTPHRTFELGWRLGCFGLFRLAHALLPRMVERGRGTMLVTSATAAVRGNEGQHSHAAAMGGRRMLCQTLNAEFARQGIHIAHIVIDGAVDAPDTLGKMLGNSFEDFKAAKGDDGVVDPAALAETYWHLAHQPRSCWSHEIDLRPWTDTPWWNDNPQSAINRN
ncbi:Short-chain dehydrogenase, associated with 2-hydroxychromene-2-carboxylate isomerase family protein [Altererythrobacter epoxidivorans]|uniref:Short-chain dehydrogenase, associated with 2-hydroxychromene-2-carboxylate isomerase family protein n=1 Tax=Altererythrobacter epoxidivorans TaxID=361183 RepID=A0A0M4MRU2_9SPHN|nr:SDR family NAD(P)-dependent oxidoreductase [Altererythrobacter epoxidivorans]ALE15758.1 Short-chain dehydrogenase, associated with 2-hydroxychromene-2-carboxylate isomerase family protein [Altererythrobacter epoxidivorans]